MNWNDFLNKEFEKPYYQKIKQKLEEERQNGKIIYPPSDKIFNAFNLTSFDNVKVIILAQDPYHSEGQAIGLAFAVNNGVKVPPSLRNIFKEIEDDLNIKCDSENGNLSRWAKQGVFLLNTTLTVRAGEPNSHENIGWRNLTSSAIKLLNDDNSPKVFLLWGNNAKKFEFILQNPAHLILKSAHPSPLSAYRGFFGCKHFSQTNQFLIQYNLSPIDWR